MQWRVMISALLIAAIILAGVQLNQKTERVCRETCMLLRASLAAAEEERTALLSEAKTVWERERTYFSLVLNHDKTDRASACFRQAEAFDRENTEDEYRAAVAELIFYVELIQDYDLPTLRSIF